MRDTLFAAILAAVPAAPVSLYAQTPKQLAGAAETITTQELARHINVIAADSMLGRDTPSRGLEMTAQYVADQFQQLGLKPGGVGGRWFQRYRVPPRLDFGRSWVVFTAGGKTAAAKFTTAARPLKLLKPWPWSAWHGDSVLPATSPGYTTFLVAGRQDVQSLAASKLGGQSVFTVLYVPPPQPDTASQKVLDFLLRREVHLVVLSRPADSADFARQRQIAQQQAYGRHLTREDWCVEVRPEATEGLPEVLAAAGVDLAHTRADTTPVIREVPSLRILVRAQLDETADTTASAPNVVGILEGSDSSLKDRYVVFVAPLDHTGLTRGRPDSIDNGADDNASGTAGLLALAKAFRQAGLRPARPIAFVATSGSAKGLWGSDAFAEAMAIETFMLRNKAELGEQFFNLNAVVQRGPDGTMRASGSSDVPDATFERHSIVRATAAINLDRIGRAAGDSVVIAGLDDAEFVPALAWTATAHPELRLTVINGGTAFTPESDRFAFARRGVPSLSFHARPGPGVPRSPVPDSPPTLEVERAARIVRLAFYVGYDLANAKSDPGWTADGRRRYLANLP